MSLSEILMRYNFAMKKEKIIKCHLRWKLGKQSQKLRKGAITAVNSIGAGHRSPAEGQMFHLDVPYGQGYR